MKCCLFFGTWERVGETIFGYLTAVETLCKELRAGLTF